MGNRFWSAAGVLMAALTIAVPVRGGAQQQPAARGDWPCGARLDPSYFHVSEGTGGHLLLLAPWEIADSASFLSEFGRHPQTIFRLAGGIEPGVHEYQVPIDPTVESVLFSISVQCLQTAEIGRPSGVTLIPAEGVTVHSDFRAQRMMIVKRPEPGVWTIRASGSGVAAIVVQARTELGITGVQFAAAGTSTFTPLPAASAENVIRIRLSGGPTDVRASLIDATSTQITALARTADDPEGFFGARFKPVPRAFRVMVAGTTADGAAFQRVHAPLFAPLR